MNCKRFRGFESPPIRTIRSYGGAIITEAGTDPHIASHAPDEGETEAANGKEFPNRIRPLVKTPDGFLFLDPANFPEDFAAALRHPCVDFLAHAQMPTAAKVFATPIDEPRLEAAHPASRAGAQNQRVNRPKTTAGNVCKTTDRRSVAG